MMVKLSTRNLLGLAALLSCSRFRFAAGSDPAHLGIGARLHRWMCPGCAKYLADMQRIDRDIRRLFAAGDRTPWRRHQGAAEILSAVRSVSSAP